MAEPDDSLEDALVSALAGSAVAFEQIYNELAGPIASYLRWNGVEDVDGLTNETMAHVHRGLSRFTGDWGAFRSWVFTIAHHRLVDDRRRRSRRPVTVSDDLPEQAVTGDTYVDLDRVIGDERVRRLLLTLSADQRDVLLLRIVGDLPLEDTAATMGKSVGAVKALQHRALAALRRHLDAEDVT